MSSQKIVALLELTGIYTGGVIFDISFHYLWTLYSEFVTFEIVDNKNDVPYLIELLDKYYQMGYRTFFGPITSTCCKGVLEWFTNHPDAKTIFPLSYGIFTLPKNIYRLAPSNFYYLDYIKENNSTDARVFYFYSSNQLAPKDLLASINAKFETVYEYPVTNSSELTTELVTTFFQGNDIQQTDIIIISLIDGDERETYFNLFNTINVGSVNQYDVLPIGFPNVENNIINLYGHYNCILNNSLNTSTILETTKNALSKKYAANSLTSLYVLTLFSNNETINDVYSYGEVVPWFDDNNGIKYWSYGIFTYGNTGFLKTALYLNDPTFGVITFNKTQQ